MHQALLWVLDLQDKVFVLKFFIDFQSWVLWSFRLEYKVNILN